MYKSHYNIAGISVVITAPTDLTDAENFSLYRTDSVTTDEIYEVSLEETTEFPSMEGSCVFQNELNMVLAQDPLLHFYRMPLAKAPCAWDYLDTSSHKTLHFHPFAADYFSNSLGIFNAIGFERVLYQFHKYLFHCSYVDYQGQAVLFSAPSGGGKTTQGLLWEKYADAVMINGDRAVLEQKDGTILCHGLPIAGSSGVFINRTLPLSAIFVLEKAPENSIVPLKGKDAVYAVYSQLTVNMWNRTFVQDAFDFAIMIASAVPIYRLSCTISEEAVELAKKQIPSGICSVC